MKYKLGDKVRVREDLIVGNHYNRNCLFTSGMDRHRGKIFSIIGVDSHYKRYTLDTDYARSYSDEMLEPVKSCSNCANQNLDALCCYECEDFDEWEEAENKPLESAYFDNMKEVSGISEDMVNHPSHYTQGKVECIDAIESATVNKKGIEAVCTGNIIKYLWRYEDKNGIQDVEKAQWYLNKLIEVLEDIDD